MQSSLITILAFVFVLGVLVFVHELGHFLAAKRVGVRVLRFQLGFNPTVMSVRRGDTEYSIGLLPLGGYVKMAGDNPDEERTGSPDEFLSKTKWERFQVLIMGPAMNVILALVVTAFVVHRGMDVPVYQDAPPVVGIVKPGSAAAATDIRPGDLILSVAGHTVDTWRQFFIAIGTRPNRELVIAVQRDGREVERKVTTTTLPGQSQFEIGEIGVYPDVHPHLQSVSPGEPGERAGLRGGDVILAVDDKPIVFHTDLRQEIAKHPGQPMVVTVERGGEQRKIPVTPGRHGTTGWLGVLPVDDSKKVQPGAFESIGLSVRTNVETAGLIFQTVWGLVTRETSPKQLMGPVAIAQLSGETAQAGLISLLTFMAGLSLNLGLVNLLPIPILDGGHIFIMGLEGLARRDFSARIKEKMLMAGFAVLVMVMATVIYNDLTRVAWIERLMPWR